MDFLNAFNLILNSPQSLTLFVAPPAWGKTSLLKKIIFKERRKLVFISPLKALAVEFYLSLYKEFGSKVFVIYKMKNRETIIEEFLKVDHGILIVTPELVMDQDLDRIQARDQNILFVFDEFHLFFFWGLDFRPLMFEVLMGVTNRGFSILGLTATLPDKLLVDIKNLFLINMKVSYLIDMGNMQLLNLPKNEVGLKFLSNHVFNRRLHFEVKRICSNETVLIFCKYRQEVDYYVEKYGKLYNQVLGCKGGEVDRFISLLDINNPPQIIVATSCLSHGVNLPQISKVFINHQVSHEFLIQMIGRGGRRGESYNAFHLNKAIKLRSLFFDLYLQFKKFVYLKLQLFNI